MQLSNLDALCEIDLQFEYCIDLDGETAVHIDCLWLSIVNLQVPVTPRNTLFSFRVSFSVVKGAHGHRDTVSLVNSDMLNKFHLRYTAVVLESRYWLGGKPLGDPLVIALLKKSQLVHTARK